VAERRQAAIHAGRLGRQSRKYLTAFRRTRRAAKGMDFNSVFANRLTSNDVSATRLHSSSGSIWPYEATRAYSTGPTLNANAKYFNDARRAAMKNWRTRRSTPARARPYTIKRRDTLRMAMTKVLRQNASTCSSTCEPELQGKIGGANIGAGRCWRRWLRLWRDARHSEVFVPAFRRYVYDAQFKLQRRCKNLRRRRRQDAEKLATSGCRTTSASGRTGSGAT